MIGKVKDFFRGVAAEYKRITWPTKKELLYSTVAVLVAVAFLSVFLGVVDWALVGIMQRLFGR